MAAEYHVRLGGKVHGPFSGAQLKKLADDGKITSDAEVRQGEAGKWYPATKVAGLFPSDLDVPMAIESDDEIAVVEEPQPKPKKKSTSPGASDKAARSGSGKAASGATPKPKRKRPAKKKRASVRAEDVFDLDDDDDEVDFVDDDPNELDFIDEDEFDDGYDDDRYDRGNDDDRYDDYAAPRRSSGRGRRSRGGGGTSWGPVRTGLLLLGIGSCLYTAEFGFEALAQLIGGLMIGTSNGSISTGRLLETLVKIGVVTGFIGAIVSEVGFSMAILSPTTKGAKGVAIAAVATMGIHIVMSFLYVIGPLLGLRSGFGFVRPSFGFSMMAQDAIAILAITYLTFFATQILTCVLLWSLAEIKKQSRHATDCIQLIWFIGIYVGLYILGWIIGQVIDPPRDPDTAKMLFWLVFLLRLGHLTLYGIFIGKLIANTFHSKSSI